MSDGDLRFRDFETFDWQTFLRDLKIIGTETNERTFVPYFHA